MDVVFEDVTYSVSVPKHDANVTTVLSAAKALCRRQPTMKRDIIKEATGTLRAGSSTLMLGPPGSGKSTLLKALAGRLAGREKPRNATLSGSITVGGHAQTALKMPRVCAYVDQHDRHEPFLTVRETFAFASTCSGEPAATRAQHVDGVISAMGLGDAADTIVGNAFVRGVSGGERKRTTVGEMLFARQPVLLLDEITTGLDSATAFNIIRGINASARDAGRVVVMTLLQPSPEIVALFDDVLLMSEGRVAFHGPLAAVAPYFAELGYRAPPTGGLGDFLVNMAGPERKRYLDASSQPVSAAGLARAWRSRRPPLDEEREPQEVDGYFLRDGRSAVALSLKDDLRGMVWHQVRLLWADRLVVALILGQSLVIGVVTGSLFLDLPVEPLSPGDSVWLRNRYAAIFFGLVLFALNSFSTLPWAIVHRDVFYKQRSAGFARSAGFVLGSAAAQAIVAVPETLILSSTVFWMSGLVARTAADSGQVFAQFCLACFLFNICLNAFMRVPALLAPSLIQVFAADTVVLAAVVLMAGFVIVKTNIAVFVVWLYWLLPMGYVFRAVAVAVFGSETFESNGLGEVALQGFGFSDDPRWFWYGLIFQVGFYIVSLFAQWVSLELVQFNPRNATATVAEDDDGDDVEEPGATLTVAPAGAEAGHALALPCPALDLAVRDISYTVRVKGGGRAQLLRDVSAFARSGRLLAIIGKTGAGKSTFLDCVSGRKTSGTLTGEILLGGTPVHPHARSYQRLLGYCEQQDNHSMQSTVREAVAFSARLRLPRDTADDAAAAFVDSIIDALELQPVKHRMIGARGLSAGQSKLLTVAVEMAANPSVLFLDEPTSGLGAAQAEATMRTIRRVCSAGRTVLCTIHQPSVEVFGLFDDMLLLQGGGRVAYHGPISGMLDFIAVAAPRAPAPVLGPDFNASTYALEVLESSINGDSDSSSSVLDDGDAGAAKDKDAGKEESENGPRPCGICSFYENSNEYRTCLETIEARARDPVLLSSEGAESLPVSAATSTVALMKRWLLTYWRAPEYTLYRALGMIGVNLVLGATFAETRELTSVAAVQSLAGIFLISIMLLGFVTMILCLPVAFDARNVYYRERHSRVYSSATYVLGSTVAELPFLFVSATVAALLLFYLIGLGDDAGTFPAFLAVFFAYLLLLTFASQCFASITSSVPQGVALAAAAVAGSGLLSGFLIAPDDTPAAFRWVFKLAPPNYALSGLTNGQLFCPCAVDAITALTPAITCDGGQDCSAVCPEVRGCGIVELFTPLGALRTTVWESVQVSFGVKEQDWRLDVLVLIAFCVPLRLIEIVALRFLTKTRK